MMVLRYPSTDFPTNGLQFRTRLDGAATDIAARLDRESGNTGALLASGSWGSTGLVSSNTTTGGAYWTPLSSLYSIGTACTIVVRATVTTLVASSKLLCIPVAGGTWSTPFMAMSFGRNSSNARLAFQYSSGSALYTATSADGGIQAGETVTYGVTRNGSTVVFYRDGVALGTNVTNLSGNFSPNFSAQQPVVLMNHASSDPGEGTTGTCFFAAVWNRTLSSGEMTAVHQTIG